MYESIFQEAYIDFWSLRSSWHFNCIDILYLVGIVIISAIACRYFWNFWKCSWYLIFHIDVAFVRFFCIFFLDFSVKVTSFLKEIILGFLKISFGWNGLSFFFFSTNFHENFTIEFNRIKLRLVLKISHITILKNVIYKKLKHFLDKILTNSVKKLFIPSWC